MHLVLTGATGLVGASVLHNMLAQEGISRISILSRRPVAMAEGHEKAKVIIHKDYKTYEKALLDQLKDAQGCVWAQGVSQNDVSAEYVFPPHSPPRQPVLKQHQRVLQNHTRLSACLCPRLLHRPPLHTLHIRLRIRRRRNTNTQPLHAHLRTRQRTNRDLLVRFRQAAPFVQDLQCSSWRRGLGRASGDTPVHTEAGAVQEDADSRFECGVSGHYDADEADG